MRKEYTKSRMNIHTDAMHKYTIINKIESPAVGISVILSERSESKDLRIINKVNAKIGGKILRLPFGRSG